MTIRHLRNYLGISHEYDAAGREVPKRRTATVEGFVESVRKARRGAFPPPRGLAEGVFVPAQLLQGDWCVYCPVPGCGGKELADPEDLRFYCLSCYNESFGHQWLAVVWPDERDAIESELLKRPQRRNQNWLVGETVAGLRRERREHLVAPRRIERLLAAEAARVEAERRAAEHSDDADVSGWEGA